MDDTVKDILSFLAPSITAIIAGVSSYIVTSKKAKNELDIIKEKNKQELGTIKQKYDQEKEKLVIEHKHAIELLEVKNTNDITLNQKVTESNAILGMVSSIFTDYFKSSEVQKLVNDKINESLKNKNKK